MIDARHAGGGVPLKSLCGLPLDPPNDDPFNGIETYARFHSEDIFGVNCYACREAYKALYPNVELEKPSVSLRRKKRDTRPGYDYTVHDPKGWCGDPRRGAALGRPSYEADDPATWEGKLYVSESRLDSGGYDENGTYFGHGDALFWVRSADYEIDYMIRAPNRVMAVKLVMIEYPKASFARPLTKDEAEWAERVLGGEKLR